MKLGEILAQTQDYWLVHDVIAAINEATTPWKLHHPIFQTMFDIDEGFDYLLIEGRFGTDLGQVFWHKMPLPPHPIEPIDLVGMIIRSFTSSFRSWRLDPEDNIILGES